MTTLEVTSTPPSASAIHFQAGIGRRTGVVFAGDWLIVAGRA